MEQRTKGKRHCGQGGKAAQEGRQERRGEGPMAAERGEKDCNKDNEEPAGVHTERVTSNVSEPAAAFSAVSRTPDTPGAAADLGGRRQRRVANGPQPGAPWSVGWAKEAGSLAQALTLPPHNADEMSAVGAGLCHQRRRLDCRDDLAATVSP